MKKIIIVLLFVLLLPCSFFAQGFSDFVSPNVASQGQEFDVHIVVPEDFIVYQQDIWCWIESGTFVSDCISINSDYPRCILATMSIPYYFPTGSCEIWVYSDAEPDPWAAPFEVVPEGEQPTITETIPDHAIQGESSYVAVKSIFVQAFGAEPEAMLKFGEMEVPALDVVQTGDDDYLISFDIPIDTTPGDWLLVLYGLEVNGNGDININTPFPVYSNLTGNLEGHVLRGGSTLEPIEGATITCIFKSTQSSADGYYFIGDIPIGEHLTTCSAPLYYNDQETLPIDVAQTFEWEFVLDWSTCNPDPLAIYKHVAPDNTYESSVELINLGNDDLTYTAGFTQWFPVKEQEKNFGDLLFSFDASTPTGCTKLSGVNTDGSYLYLTDYDSSDIHKFEFDGTYIGSFSIPGASNFRDLAYDGNYFYGGKSEMYFWEMDFNTLSNIDLVYTLMQIKAMTYDSVNDGFWVSNCFTDFRFIDRIGMQQDLIPTSGYKIGIAYDNFSDGGPYLWSFRMINGPVQECWIEQIDIATGLPTGVEIQVNDDLGDGYAAGLFCSDQIIPGKVVLGGIISKDTGDVVFGYEIKSDRWCTITENATGTIPAEGSINMSVELDATGLSVGETNYGNIIIQHDGSDTTDVIIPVTMIVSYDVDDPPLNQAINVDAYPNPTSGSIEIHYTLPLNHQDEEIVVSMYNMKGQKVDSINGKNGLAEWKHENISSGIYFFKIEKDDVQLVKKILILK